jgi:cytochrome c biogenesis protein CcdA
MNNNFITMNNAESSLERLRKSDRRLKLVLAAVFFIVGLATVMVVIGSINSM